MIKEIIQNKSFDEERAFYGRSGIMLENCRFEGKNDGESAVKRCKDIIIKDCFFDLRYPVWHTENCGISESEMTVNCRAPLWYCSNIGMTDSVINGIKAYRECDNISLERCRISSEEFMWKCRGVDMTDCTIISQYPFFECRDMTATGLELKGKYSFQYAENVTLSGCRLDTKDAFWHAKNVTVTDSVIKGEYLGWYSQKLRLIRCHIIGIQPLCECRELVLEDCTMEKADLCFEHSEVRADIRGYIISVKNPLSGEIAADSIGAIITDECGENVVRTAVKNNLHKIYC